MPGSPFSNVLGHAPGDSTFKDVETTETSGTTAAVGARPEDSDTESSIGVTHNVDGSISEAEQDETVGDAPSGRLPGQ